ncbi:ABC transporter involved in cytochrome c biogenesis, CcmB subunit [Desulfosporosinus sp. I2]|uniref:heme exporter protein CcmB n=1 Tax=Desulfosporosinus sp. I2 TaxID=1617025 RepID=UPI0005EE3086|nr:heme exporter protein CcmB [Desulfosporosinus sp. I2]KJR46231.1 ABC transporter involved in cytochrome c biogenesis, CcmB subunit [Desulfosporosinus sp. I2]
MSFIRKVRSLLWKEIRSELQGKEMLSTMIVFSLLVVVVFGFAIDLNKDLMGGVLPGIIWITMTFAGILCLNRSFTAEQQNDCLYGLMLCPLDRSAIYVAKTIMNLLLMVIVEGVTIPLFFIIFNYPGPQQVGLFVIVLLLGTYCFMAVGTFLAALSSATKTGEILMPILLIPLIIPVLLSAVIVTKGSFGLVVSGADLYLKILVVYGVVFTVLPMLLFDYLLEV